MRYRTATSDGLTDHDRARLRAYQGLDGETPRPSLRGTKTRAVRDEKAKKRGRRG